MADNIDPNRIFAALLNTGLQSKDNPLFQVLRDLINNQAALTRQISSGSGGVGPPGPAGPTGPSGAAGASGIPGFILDDSFIEEVVPVIPAIPASGITSPEVPIVLTVNTKIDTNFGEVIPESLVINGGVDLEIASGARLEITGQIGGTTAGIFSSGGGTTNNPVQSLSLAAQKNTAVVYFFNTTICGGGVGIGFQAITVTDPGAGGFIKDGRGNWRRITATPATVSALTATSDFVWLDHEPRLLIHLRFGPSISGMRFWAGFWSANATDADINGRTGAGVRYSTVAGDTGFVPQSSDGVSQVLGSSLGTIAINEEYLLSITLTNNGAFLNVSVERQSTGVVNTGRIATLLGARGQNNIAFQIRNSTTDGVNNKSIDIERVGLEFGFLMAAI